MRRGLKRVEPSGSSWDVLRQLGEVVYSLMRGIDGLVRSRFDLVAVRDIFEVWVVLIAGRCPEK